MQFLHDLLYGSRVTLGIVFALSAIMLPCVALASSMEDVGTKRSNLLLFAAGIVAAPFAYALLKGVTW
jgi:hypothetical protein